MKLLCLLLAATTAFAADWDAVQRIPIDHKIEVTMRKGTATRALFLSASADGLVVREKTGERSITRTDIRKVGVLDPSRRIRSGLIGTAIGAGAGAGIGFAICPYCPNEGHGNKFIGPGMAIGAALGALSFLSAPYKTVYKAPRI